MRRHVPSCGHFLGFACLDQQFKTCHAVSEVMCGSVQMIRAADPKTRPQVLEILDSAQSLGLKVLRMWAFNEGPLQFNTLQRYPGTSQPCSLACYVSWSAGMSV